MASQPGKQTVAIHTLSNISRSKINHTPKFGQLKEYKMRNVFFENDTQNKAEKLLSDPFLENQN